MATWSSAAASTALSTSVPASTRARTRAPSSSSDSTPENKMNPSDLKGKKVVLTGTFVTMKRDEAEKLLTEAGATISGSISKSTDLLIHGEKAGSKLAKATSLGVARMTEAE